jgi:hypothetical protein
MRAHIMIVALPAFAMFALAYTTRTPDLMDRAGVLRLYEAGRTYALSRAIADAATKRELVAKQRPAGWVPPNIFQFPMRLTKSYGARPTRAAICLRLIWPSSGNNGDDGEGERGADALHRGQEFITPSEIGIAGNDLSHASVEQKDIGCEPRQATFVEAPQHGILEVGGLVFDRDMLVAKLSPHGDDLSELFCGRIALHDPCWHDRNIRTPVARSHRLACSRLFRDRCRFQLKQGLSRPQRLRQTCRANRSPDWQKNDKGIGRLNFAQSRRLMVPALIIIIARCALERNRWLGVSERDCRRWRQVDNPATIASVPKGPSNVGRHTLCVVGHGSVLTA